MTSMSALMNQIKTSFQDWTFPFRCRRHPRRFQAYCIGTGKSGTHSIAEVFHRHYRAAHEPERDSMIVAILAAAHGSLGKLQKIEFIRKRDQRLWLELESSAYLYYFLKILLTEFPGARFILTIRDCYSWLNSYLNHKLARTAPELWLKMREFRYQPDQFQYAPEEKMLAEHGLYPLDSYLSVWGKHNRDVLTLVPPQRLLVVRTHEISLNIPTIAEFIGIPPETLDSARSHAFKAQKKFELLSQINRDFLEDKVQRHCRVLMDMYFPEIRCFTDVIKD